MAKNPGSALECADQRVRHLMSEYERYIASRRFICMTDFFEYVVRLPSPRFWVSGCRAKVVVVRMLQGDGLSGMRVKKREMFREIFRRVLALRDVRPDLTLSDICDEVVMQPAPESYLTPSSAKIYFYKARRKWFERKMRR